MTSKKRFNREEYNAKSDQERVLFNESSVVEYLENKAKIRELKRKIEVLEGRQRELLMVPAVGNVEGILSKSGKKELKVSEKKEEESSSSKKPIYGSVAERRSKKPRKDDPDDGLGIGGPEVNQTPQFSQEGRIARMEVDR